MTNELNFELYVNFTNLNSHMWPPHWPAYAWALGTGNKRLKQELLSCDAQGGSAREAQAYPAACRQTGKALSLKIVCA